MSGRCVFFSLFVLGWLMPLGYRISCQILNSVSEHASLVLRPLDGVNISTMNKVASGTSFSPSIELPFHLGP